MPSTQKHASPSRRCGAPSITVKMLMRGFAPSRATKAVAQARSAQGGGVGPSAVLPVSGKAEVRTRPEDKPEGGDTMQRKCFVGVMGLVVMVALLYAPPVVRAKDKVVLGHPEALSGQYAKAGAQAVGGIKAIVSWINQVYGGVNREGKKVPLTYMVYDCESKKEAVTSLIARLVTVD